MCGIAGVLSSDKNTVDHALRVMNYAQAHRGPDGSGKTELRVGTSSYLGLGHRRLSIIDLSHHGAQPMQDGESGNVLCFNGEIYNFGILRSELIEKGHKFRSRTDSEVLLKALTEWGVDCIPRLKGMFAFLFFEHASQSLLIARDPLGIKPLYIGRSEKATLFASEVRPIIATGLVSTAIDRRGLAGYFSYGSFQHPFTLFQSITSFPAGCWQQIEANGLQGAVVRYWRTPRTIAPRSDKATLDAVQHTIDAAVRDHLVSDVPLGVFLSSGIDSTIIAGIAAKHAPNLSCLTVGFAENSDMSELQLAEKTARRFGLRHVPCYVESADALKVTSDWLANLDLPSIDGLNVYVISKAVKEQGITVALSGQGGDELFGGYSSFTDVSRLRRLMAALKIAPPAMRKHLAHALTTGMSPTARSKIKAVAACNGDIGSIYTLRRRLMLPDQLNALGFDAIRLGLNADFHDPEEIETIEIDPQDAVWSISNLECRLYLGNMLLRDGDANSMANALEVRVPFLDRRLLDLALALPGAAKLPESRANKHLLRAGFSDLLSDDLLRQSKRGFFLPLKRWMLGPLQQQCREGIETLKTSGLVEEKIIDSVWNNFIAAPESAAWTRAFSLVVLGQYLRTIATSSDRRMI